MIFPALSGGPGWGDAPLADGASDTCKTEFSSVAMSGKPSALANCEASMAITVSAASHGATTSGGEDCARMPMLAACVELTIKTGRIADLAEAGGRPSLDLHQSPLALQMI